MSDDIVSRQGAVVGHWDGKSASTLKNELARVKQVLRKENSKDKVEPAGIPHQDQFPGDLKNFTAYLLWGCDQSGVCLVGSGANRLESVESLREFYAGDTAKDALARHQSE